MFSFVLGCHINPAVSLAMMISGRMKPVQFLVYCAGQFFGAFLGAFFIWAVYYDVIQQLHYDDTIGIFATYPSDCLSIFGGFLDQFFSTSLLIIFVLAINDNQNNQLPNGSGAILVGLTVIAINMSFSFNCGVAIINFSFIFNILSNDYINPTMAVCHFSILSNHFVKGLLIERNYEI